MRSLIRMLFLSALVACWLLGQSVVINASPQKSLDDEGKSDSKKTETKKPKGSGKDLDELPKSGGKGLDSVGGKGLDSVDTPGKKAEKTDKVEKTEKPTSSGKTLDSVEASKSSKKVKDNSEAKDAKNEPPERVKPRRDPEPRIEKREKEPVVAKKDKEKEDEPIELDTGPDYPELVAIPGGSFSMGSKDGGAYESPVHDVKVSPFEMSKFEITNHQFRVFVKATNYQTLAERDGAKITWQSYAIKGRAKFPVVMISWEDVVKYCEWLSTVNNATYRLPSEAEWEFAARGGSKDTPFPWGDKLEVSQANFAADDSRNAYAEPILDFLQPVGNYQPNAFGLYDVIGNVWEWSNDWFSDSYYRDSPAEDPKGPETGKSRVIRGGGWGNKSLYCSVSFRKPCPPSFKSSSLGFRVVKVINQTPNGVNTAKPATDNATSSTGNPSSEVNKN